MSSSSLLLPVVVQQLVRRTTASTQRRIVVGIGYRTSTSICSSFSSFARPTIPTRAEAAAATATKEATEAAPAGSSSEEDKPFELPSYQAPTSYEITPEVEAVMKEILNIKTKHEYNTVGYLLAYRMGVSSELLQHIIQGGGGSGGGGEGGESAAAAPVVEEVKTDFDLKITGLADAKSKLKVIKEVRGLSGDMGLKEAKEFVENLPKVFMKNMKKEQAEELKAKLEAVGAVVELE